MGKFKLVVVERNDFKNVDKIIDKIFDIFGRSRGGRKKRTQGKNLSKDKEIVQLDFISNICALRI